MLGWVTFRSTGSDHRRQLDSRGYDPRVIGEYFAARAGEIDESVARLAGDARASGRELWFYWTL
jgi:hypothetical protein